MSGMTHTPELLHLNPWNQSEMKTKEFLQEITYNLTKHLIRVNFTFGYCVNKCRIISYGGPGELSRHSERLDGPGIKSR
jgi:hypothetical protein